MESFISKNRLVLGIIAGVLLGGAVGEAHGSRARGYRKPDL